MAPTTRIRAHVQSVVDPDGAVLLDLKKGKYFSLNGIAADIWGGIEAGLTLPQIEARLAASYDAPAGRLRADVDSFVAQLARAELIHAAG